MTKLRVLDLFSGIGGFSLGLERAGGFETVAFCEIEPYCRAVLAKHWPNVKQYDDVRTLTAETLRRDGIAVDVICGGFPCQDISSAGLRKGLEGERSGLWKEYARLIGELRPDFIVMENVADLCGRGLGDILGALATLGYDAEWHCIPACGLGADHIRDRVWIVAYPNSAGVALSRQCRREQRQAEVGKDAARDHAHEYSARLSRRVPPGKIREDERAISPWLGLAISTAPPFPRLDGSGAPVLGRGENGIPNRMDRVHAIGNAVVPQIPELIGKAIMQAEGMTP